MSDLVMPGVVGHPPFSDTSLVSFCSEQPLSCAGIQLTSGSALRPTAAVEVIKRGVIARHAPLATPLSLISAPVVSYFVLFSVFSLLIWFSLCLSLQMSARPAPATESKVHAPRFGSAVKYQKGPMIYVKLNSFVGSLSREIF